MSLSGWPGDLIRAFYEGLTRPSASALATALAGTGLLAAVLLAGVTESNISRVLPYFAGHGRDYDVYLTEKVLALATADSPGESIFILGGSATRASLASDEEITDLVRRRSGGPWEVSTLSLPGMAIWEMAAVVENLPSGRGGRIFLAVNPVRLSRDRDLYEKFVSPPRLGFTSSAFDEECRTLLGSSPHRSGIYLFDNRSFLAPRLKHIPKNIALKPPNHILHPNLGQRLPGPRRLKKIRENVVSLLAGYEASSAMNFASLARVIAQARDDKGLQVILLESPVNPELLTDGSVAALYETYRTAVGEFAAKNRVGYWQLDEEAGLTGRDFRDFFHIHRREALDRYTEAFVSRLPADGEGLFTSGENRR